MKSTRWFIAVLVAGMMVLQATAFAEMIQGVINSVDKASSSLILSRTDPATGTSEDLVVSVAKDAKFKGISSLEELQAGDQVRLEAAPNPSGVLEAKKIETL